MSHELFERHRDMLEKAVAATRSREYFSAFDESPSPRVYGEDAAPSGKAAFEAHLGSTFPLTTPGSSGTVSTEKSPFGFALDVAYPRVAPAGGRGVASARIAADAAAAVKAYQENPVPAITVAPGSRPQTETP